MPERPGWRGNWPPPETLRARINRALGTEITEGDCRRLIDFLQMLERWAAKFNLISASSRDEVIDRHLLDSLAVLALVGEAARIADLGSGAGFPGVPVAMLRPGSHVFLVEPRAHRANFLRQATRTLALANAEVCEVRGEAFAADHAVDLVVARAVRLDELGAFAAAALTPEGRVIAMAKASTGEPPPAGFAVTRRHPYRLPDGSAHALIELARG